MLQNSNALQKSIEGLEPLSALGQVWARPDAHTSRVAAALRQSLGVPSVVAEILAQRDLGESEKASAFLTPRLEALPDPATLKDMDKAIAALGPAVQSKKTIGIFGDYDVDGTCATAILSLYFEALGVPVVRYIPDRLTEGYGPNPAAMRAIQAQGVELLITVDTGTNAPEALNEAAAIGLPVIVTDHHPPAGDLPPALAVLNPQRADCTSELQGLCGSGVAFYMLLGLNRTLRQAGYFAVENPEPKLTKYLDLVGLATVADVMPLKGANRLLVAKGLQQLGTWQHAGLAALASVAGVKDEPSAHTLGFVLGPRLNAAGRIDSATAAVNLLLAKDEHEALPLAQHLHALNAQRQEMEKAMVAEALQQAEAQLKEETTLAPVLHAAHWHPGVVGIAASRVKDKTGRPCFVLGTDSNGHIKGSGRSAAGLDLGAAVAACEGLLLSGGGHAAAAGVTLKPENLAAFRKTLNEALWQQLDARPDAANPLAYRLAPTLTLSATASVASLSGEEGIALAQALQQLGPFGHGNPEPVLWLPQASVAHVRAVGADASHLRVRLVGPMGQGGVDAMAFSAAGTPLGQVLQNSGGKAIQIAATVKLRYFNNRPMLDVFIKDAYA